MAAFCDLHTHTLHSDGTLAPESLVDFAAERGVVALAVTDHDTLDGLAAAMERGRALGVEVVPGIELSVEMQGRDIHLLGYFVTKPEALVDVLGALRRQRQARLGSMLARLRALGYDLDAEAVRARARGGVVGRPHVAEELVARGHAPDIHSAFDRWLGRGRPAYVAKVTPSIAMGAALLRRAGAVPVVAHPGASDCDALVPLFRDAGVLGLEVWHPKHDEGAVRRYLRLARRYGLVPTGGSDFHREAPGAVLPGEQELPLSVLEALRPLAA